MQLDKDNRIWMGKLPKDWKTRKIKYVLWQRNEDNAPIKSTNILSLTAKQGVIPYKEKQGGGNKPKQDLSAYKLAYPGDIVMNSMNILSGAVGLSKYMGCVSPVYYMLRPISKKDDVRFFYYAFANTVFQRSLLGIGNGILIKKSNTGTYNTIRMRIPIEKLKNLAIPYPSSYQQKSIADFLDKKCTEINDLSNQVKKEINALQKYRKAVITKAVTKGVNASLPMKNSGIEWLGNISNEAIVTKLKFILTSPMKYGANEAGIEYSSELPRYIRITDITTDSKLKKNNKLSLSKEQAREYILKDKAILFARSGGTVGKTFFYRENMGLAAFAGYLISANVDEEKACPEFVYYYTQSSPYEKWKDQIFSQATIQNIGADKYSNMPIPIFKKIDYQKKIVSYLNSKTKQIDKVIQLKQNQLALLSDYKNSLIFEYVTGRKQIPNVGEK